MTPSASAWKRLSERLLQQFQVGAIMSDHLRLESAVHLAEIVQFAGESQIGGQLFTKAETSGEALGTNSDIFKMAAECDSRAGKGCIVVLKQRRQIGRLLDKDVVVVGCRSTSIRSEMFLWVRD